MFVVMGDNIPSYFSCVQMSVYYLQCYNYVEIYNTCVKKSLCYLIYLCMCVPNLWTLRGNCYQILVLLLQNNLFLWAIRFCKKIIATKSAMFTCSLNGIKSSYENTKLKCSKTMFSLQ